MPSNMVAEWKKAKEEFEEVTGRKRPKETFLKLFTKGSGIEPALKKCDQLANIAPPKNDTAAKLREAIDDLMEKVQAYLVILDRGIDQEGDAKTDMKKALKALKAKTDKFKPHYEVFIVEMQNPGLDGMNASALPKLKRAVASALADIKRVLAKPDFETYDAVMEPGKGEAGRRLTTALHAVEQAGGHGNLNTQAFKTRLNAYATGDKRTMKGDATKEEVIAEIKAFALIVKDLATQVV